MLQPQAFGEMDVMDDENAWTYWSRSDAHAMVMNLGGNPKARDALCRATQVRIATRASVTPAAAAMSPIPSPPMMSTNAFASFTA